MAVLEIEANRFRSKRWACNGRLKTTLLYMACSDRPCINVGSVIAAAVAAAANVAAVAPATAGAPWATAAEACKARMSLHRVL